MLFSFIYLIQTQKLNIKQMFAVGCRRDYCGVFRHIHTNVEGKGRIN